MLTRFLSSHTSALCRQPKLLSYLRLIFIFVACSLLRTSATPKQKITERTREPLNPFACNTAFLRFPPPEPKRTQETQSLSTAKPTAFPHRKLPSPNLLISKINAACLLHLRRFSPTLDKYDAPVELRPLPAAQPCICRHPFRTGRRSDYRRDRTCIPPARLTPQEIENFGPLAGNKNPVSGPTYL